MSTLTKTLIVLLTLSSIFLCGIVVTYVASANNFKQEYEKQKSELDAIKSLSQTKIRSADERIADSQRRADEALQKITEIEAQKAQMKVDLDTAQRSSYGCQERLTNLAGVVSGLNQTISSMDQSLTLTRAELDKARNEQVKNRKELNEITAALNEKTVQVDALENERRRLLEQKTALDAAARETCQDCQSLQRSSRLRPNSLPVQRLLCPQPTRFRSKAKLSRSI